MSYDGSINDFSISRYPFDKIILSKLKTDSKIRDTWPLIYILKSDVEKEAYIGESTDVINRISNHINNPKRKQLNEGYFITSLQFNKSATLNIEANLIRYLGSDGKYELQNGNAGLSNHDYYKKEDYEQLFSHIWEELRKRGVVSNRLIDINASDLFIYSPYKSLTPDQFNSIQKIIGNLIDPKLSSTFIEGSAGTGKTILAIFLMKLLLTDFEDLFEGDELEIENEKELIWRLKQKYPKPEVALVVPMVSLRNTLKAVFGKIKGLNSKMVIGPSDVFKKEYDILIVDEAHRLRRRVNITNYKSFDDNNKRLKLDHSGTELDWILRKSRKHVFFYDADQSVKPSDVRKDAFDTLLKKSGSLSLHTQKRIKGGVEYMSYVSELLNNSLGSKDIFKHSNYEFYLFDSFADMVDQLKQKESEVGLSRLVAGYSWEWKSKRNKRIHDIEIDGVKLKWNSTPHEWINSENAKNEAGCIHTTQGYDLNYTGLIYGNEITYDPKTNRIEIARDNYQDKKGKIGVDSIEELRTYIVNIYRTSMYRGAKGTYVYVCDPELRKYFLKHISKFEKQNEARIIYLNKKLNDHCIPVIDIQAAAGKFSDIQKADISQWFQLPASNRIKEGYFACRVIGDSMNKKIANGSLCLFERYTAGSREGKIVLVEHYKIQDSEFGAGYTVKVYKSTKAIKEEGWSHESIILEPFSNNPSHEPIVLNPEETSELKVLGIFVKVISV